MFKYVSGFYCRGDFILKKLQTLEVRQTLLTLLYMDFLFQQIWQICLQLKEERNYQLLCYDTAYYYLLHLTFTV